MHIPYKIKMLVRTILMHKEGELIIRSSYQDLCGREFDENKLETFTDKIFNRMIMIHRNRSTVYTRLSDKILVRNYVKEKIGHEFLTKLIWHGSNAKKIPFHKIPEKCIIKTNHGSGTNIVINGEFDKTGVTKKLESWLKGNYYWESREYQYYDIKPQILIEEFIDDGHRLGPLDYRFWCFNGTPKLIQIDNHHHDINPFYDTSWNKLELRYRNTAKDIEIEKPVNFEKMLDISSKLSSDFDFVRVDLFNSNGRILFGELTFTPVAGRIKFTPEAWNIRLGKLWKQTGFFPSSH